MPAAGSPIPIFSPHGALARFCISHGQSFLQYSQPVRQYFLFASQYRIFRLRAQHPGWMLSSGTIRMQGSSESSMMVSNPSLYY